MADYHSLPPFVSDQVNAAVLVPSLTDPLVPPLLNEPVSSEDHEEESLNGEEAERKSAAAAPGTEAHLHGEPDDVDLKVDEGSKQYRVFLGDNVHLHSEFPEGTAVHWRFQAQPHACTDLVLHLPLITLAQLGDYECEDSNGHIMRCSLVKNKSPFKFCETCHRRQHAHAKHCSKCGSLLHVKARPPKRKGESLTPKNFEDAILEKLRSFREVHGEDVDTVLIVSRRHYHRTLTTIYSSPGVARAFMQHAPAPGAPTVEQALGEAWGSWLDHHHTTTRSSDRRRQDHSAIPQVSLDASIGSLVRTLQPVSQQPPPPPPPPPAPQPTFQNFLEFSEPLPPTLTNPQDAQSIPLLDQSMLGQNLSGLPMATAFSFPHASFFSLLRPNEQQEPRS